VNRLFARVGLLLGLLLLHGCVRQPAEPVEFAESPALRHYTQRDWSKEYNKKLNISVFIFRDHNRNGLYDVGDLPLTSVAVDLTRPDGSTRTKRSNKNGFANFVMSLNREKADVPEPRKNYEFEVLVPPGWAATTQNVLQAVSFRRLPGSVTGLVAEQPPTVVGLAPDLTVSGRVVAHGAEGRDLPVSDIHLVSIDPDDRRLEQHFDNGGDFSFPVRPGKWVLVSENVDTREILRREFEVKNKPVRLSALRFGEEKIETLQTPVIQDFEYLKRSFIGKIPGGLLGLTWDYLIAVDNQHYNGPGYVNTLVSGRMVGYNSSGHPVTISSDSTDSKFDFVGGFFGAAWPKSEGETLRVEAWRNGEPVAVDTVSLSCLGPVWFDADYRQIDRLRLTTGHYWQFVTDDMQFRVLSGGVTPAKVTGHVDK
jgi:hypothetical protein